MREKENARLAQGSFIHRLIEEALLQFTSLQGGTTSADLPGAAAAPLNADLFMDPESPAGQPAVPGRPGDGPEHGNLATLEDEDEDEDEDDAAMPSRAGGARPAAARAPAAGVPALCSPGDPATSSDLAPRTSRRAALAIAVLVVLVAAALAWFTRIIPHH